MCIKDELERMEAQNSIGNNLEWNQFKLEVEGVISELEEYKVISVSSAKITKAENNRLRKRVTSLEFANRKHLKSNATLRVLLKELFNK